MILVIGFGSIGARHARLLTELGQNVAVVSRQSGLAYPVFESVAEALAASQPTHVVVANETSLHYQTLTELAAAGFRGTVLVEKPLFHVPYKAPDHSFKNLFVAYNLRFHPLMQKLREAMGQDPLRSLHIYTGQHLSTWRPGRDYRETYSAHRHRGGGVLRDLSHELDYALWFSGGCRSLQALGGHISGLEIDSDDSFSLLFQGPNCPIVTISINYLDHIKQRQITAILDDRTIKADFVSGTLQINGATTMVPSTPDESYLNLHRALLAENIHDFCSYQRGVEILAMIDQAETRAREAMEATL